MVFTLLRFMQGNSPEMFLNKIIFLTLVLAILTLVISFPTYIIKYKRALKFTDLKSIYRNSIKTSLKISIFLTVVLAMKIFGVLNFLNFGLLVILVLVIARVARK